MSNQNKNVLLTGDDDASATAHLYSWIFRQEDNGQNFVLNFNSVLWPANLMLTAKLRLVPGEVVAIVIRGRLVRCTLIAISPKAQLNPSRSIEVNQDNEGAEDFPDGKWVNLMTTMSNEN